MSRYLGFGFTTLPERVTTGAGAAGTWLDVLGWLGAVVVPSAAAGRAGDENSCVLRFMSVAAGVAGGWEEGMLRLAVAAYGFA